MRVSGRKFSPLTMSVALLLTVVTAVVLGLVVAGRVRMARLETLRRNATASALAQTDNLKLGDTLPDALLEDLRGDTVRLSATISRGNTLIAFVQPGCIPCDVQIESISKLPREKVTPDRFILISSANVRILREMQSSQHLTCRILYDYSGKYISSLAIATFPFNLLVGDERTIRFICPGPILESEMLDLFSNKLSDGT